MFKGIVVLGGAIALLHGCGGNPQEPPEPSKIAWENETAERLAGGMPTSTEALLGSSSAISGRSFDAWTEAWWRWQFSVPAEKNPVLDLDADCGEGQNDSIFFVPSYDGSKTYVRTCRVPLGKPVLIPLWVVVNDYPCPDPTFEPAPGESLERFLQNGAREYTDQVKGTTAEWDERGIDLRRLRHTSDLFTFKAQQSLVGKLPDPCLQGEPQSGVSDGYWLMVLPRPGRHVIRVRAIDPAGEPIDQTYRLDVGR